VVPLQQRPSEGSHVALPEHVRAVPPWHTPAVQMSPLSAVHRLPSSHAVPLASTVPTHVPAEQ